MKTANLQKLPARLIASDDRIKKKDMSRTRHGITLLKTGAKLLHFLEQNPIGKLYMEADLYFTPDGRKYIPDLSFCFRDNYIRNDERDILIGIPDLIMEIISPTSYIEDTTNKFDQYASFGVKEYWLVAPHQRQITVYTLENGQYVIYQMAGDNGSVRSKLIPDFVMELNPVFEL